MTTRTNGRPAATTASRTAGVLLRLSLTLALCAPALGASAAPIDDAAPFPTKGAAAKPASEKVASEKTAAAKPDQPAATREGPSAPTSLSNRALMLAADMNRLISPMTLAPLALDLPDEAVGGPVQVEGDGKVKSVLQKALALLGTPYRWGGTDPDKGFDCSGLVGYVFRNALGIELPRVSRDMAKASSSNELITDRAKLAAGDLVFFGLKGKINHVGIYVGDGRFVHAPRRGKDVTVSSLDKGYWSGRFMQARRVSTDGT